MNDVVARDCELYVMPAERGKMGGLFMMKKFIEWAKNKLERIRASKVSLPSEDIIEAWRTEQANYRSMGKVG